MCLQKDKRKKNCRKDFYPSSYTWNLADFFAVHVELGKYGQDKVLVLKGGHGLLYSSVNTGAVWMQFLPV